MFGGDPSNLGFPLFLEENNGFQYDSNVLPQLQLFGNYPVEQNIGPLNYVRKNEPNTMDHPAKRLMDAETITRQQIHPLTLNVNDKSYKDEAGHSGSIFNPIAVSTGLKLSYEEDEHNSSVTSVSENVTAALPAILSLGDSFKVIEVDHQKKEMDLYMKAQEDILIKGLRELRQKQTVALLSTIEKRVAKKLQEKDLELEMMNCKNRELEERIKQVTNEVQTWHYRAKYNESMVNVLKNNLQQVMANGAMQGKEGCGDSEVDDAASYANHNNPMDGFGDPRFAGNKMACKSCKIKGVEMLLLPCRHLCLCKQCDTFVDVCPLCHVMKTASAQVLKAFHYPATMILAQFAVGSVVVILMRTFNLYKRPNINSSQLWAIVPLAVVHTLGNLFTNMSLGKVAVSFTHTIKAMEPFFSVLLSAFFWGEYPTPWVVGSLLPIVGGVALASMTKASFNWAGFWSAMASNLTNQSRNVLSKKVMVKKEESMDNITLFSIITTMSFVLLFPVTLYLEGFKFSPAYFELAAQKGMNVKQVVVRSLLAALCFHAYQQVSYMILQRVSLVTHSVGDCVKRVVVIVSTVLFFRTPVSPINSLGTGIALAGVFLYSRVKRTKPKPKTVSVVCNLFAQGQHLR